MIKKGEILIIDDDLLNREKLIKILSGASYQVSTLVNEKGLFDTLSKEIPDLILLDVMLENESGLELLKKIKQNPQFKHISIILISSKNKSSKEQALGIKIGAEGYLTRPVETKELLTRVEALLRYKRALDNIRKQPEEKIIHLNSILQTTRLVNRLIIKEKDTNTLIKGVCDILIETRGYNFIWIALVNEKKQYVSIVEAGLGDELMHLIEMQNNKKTLGCTKKTIDSGGLTIIKNKKAECENCPVKLFQDDAVMTTPIIYQGEIYGVMTVSLPHKFINDEEEQKLFSEVAQNLGHALNNIEQKKKKKEAEIKLFENSEQLDLIYNSTSDLMALIKVIDQKSYRLFFFNDLYWNTIAENYQGIPRQQLESISIVELSELLNWPKSVLDGAISKYEEVIKTKKTKNEIEIMPTQAGMIYLDSSYSPILTNNGEVGYILFSASNITEKHLAEEAINESRARLIVAQQIGRMGDFRWDLNTNEVNISEGLEDLLQYKKSEIANYSQLDSKIHHPDDKDKINQWFSESIETNVGRLSPFEYRVIRSDGKVLYVRLIGVIVRDLGKPVRIIATILDITKRKKIELALKENENKLREIIDATPFPIALADTNDDKIIYWSQSAKELFGHTAPSTAEWYRLAYPNADYRMEMINRWKSQLKKAKQSSNAVYTGTYEITCKDGSVCICELYAKFIPDNLIVTFNDITERKKAEEAHRGSEERIRLLLDSTAEGIYGIDLNGDCIFINASCQNMLGYEPDENLIGKNMHQLMHHSKADGSNYSSEECSISEAYKKGKGKHAADEVFWRKDGSAFPVEYWSFPIYKENKLIGAVVNFTDIAERKKAEEALRHSEEIFRRFMEHSPIYVFFKDKNIRSLRLSKNYEQMLNKPLAELLGKNMDDLFSSETAKKMVANDIRILNEGKTIEVEEELNERFYTTIKFPIIIDGEAEYLAGYTIDITDRKVAEEEIIQSQKRYKALFDDSPVPLWEEDFSDLFGYIEQIKAKGVLDLRAYFNNHPDELISCSQKVKIIDVNEATLKLHETKTKEDLLGNLEKIFTEKSLEVFKEEVLAITSGKLEFQAEGEIRTLAGKTKEIYLKLVINKEVTVKHRALLATVDITARKKMERELSRHHQELEKQVKERTFELEEKNKYLERINNAMIDREFRIKELRDEIELLKANQPLKKP